MHYNRFRYYDPSSGRFISQDPIGLEGGINLYEYVPNPIGWVDPFGLKNYRDKFWERVGGQNRDDYQVHHIIPQAVFTGGSQGQYRAAANVLRCHGLDQDSWTNLIALPKNASNNPRLNNSWFGKSQHNSHHNGYSNAVSNAIIRIGSKGNCAQQKMKILALQSTLRRGLQRGEILMPRLGGTEHLWNQFLRGY